MVYSKDSKGCETCRIRKIKCDEAVPVCQRCKLSSRECVPHQPKSRNIFRHYQKPPALKIKGSGIDDESVEPDVKLGDHFNAPLPWREPAHVNQSSATALSSGKADIDAPPLRNRWTGKPSIQTLQPLQAREAAIQIYFKDFLRELDSFHPELTRFLPSAYEECQKNSPLKDAIQALAMYKISSLEGLTHLRQEGLLRHNNAIRTLARSIRDAKEVVSNEVSLSILTLSLLEYVAPSNASLDVWANHVSGLAIILKLRGASQLQDRIAAAVFSSAIRQLLLLGLLRPGSRILCDWNEMYFLTAQFKSPFETQLIRYAVQVTSLRAEIVKLQREERSPASMACMANNIKLMRRLETRFMAFESSLMLVARPKIVAVVSKLSQPIEAADAWLGPVHVYKHLQTASEWNHLYTLRFYAIVMILSALKWMYPDDYVSQPGYYYLTYQAQKCVDGICFNVPYILGYASDDGLTHSGNVFESPFLMFNLYSARAYPGISELQKKWITGRLALFAQKAEMEFARILLKTDLEFIE